MKSVGSSKKTERMSGIELLRILGIFMVVFIHATGLIQEIPVNSVGAVATRIINCMGNLGVPAFILISGFFGVKRNWKKMMTLEMKVILYSVCTTVLLRLVWPMDYPRSVILPLLEQSVMPVVTRKHWYYSCYMCLLLFAPYINLVIEKITEKEYQLLLGAGLVIFCLVPTFLRYDIMQDGGKGLVNMVLLYLLGRYIRLYQNRKIGAAAGSCVLIALLLVLFGLTYVPVRTNVFALDVLEDNSLTTIAICVAALYLFKDMKLQSAVVNRAAEHVFGIYILNVPVMRVLNHFVFRLDQSRISGNLMPVWVSLLVLTTVLVCLILDVLHDKLLSGMEEKICDRVIKYVEKKLQR